jgi:hypothetical protein
VRIIQAILWLIDDLIAGDPVAVGFVSFFVVVGLLFMVFAYILKSRVDAEDRRFKDRWKNR